MFAMAGIAELAIKMHIAMTWIGLFIIGGLTLITFMSGKKWMHVTVLIIAFVFGIFFVPWEAPFVSLSAEGQQDPDAVKWFSEFQNLAYGSYIVMTAVLANSINFFLRRRTVNCQKIEQVPLGGTCSTPRGRESDAVKDSLP
ncbi:MAG: hypothetical protein SFX18_04590 [Pirellulales bacterium]|nr:hypothetical protein [Pirellulales bacterium]